MVCKHTLYGLFHETFKMSQGAFILSFMIGMMMDQKKFTIQKKIIDFFNLVLKKFICFVTHDFLL